MKKLIAILPAIVLLSMITGCSQSHGDSTIPTGTQKPNETADASQPESAETPETNKPADVETTQLGFPELSERYGIMDYLQDKYPWWLEEYEFVRDAEGMKVTVDITEGNAQETTRYPYKGATELFPVLMLDGQRMICLNEYGNGLPNFTVETMADVLMPS